MRASSVVNLSLAFLVSAALSGCDARDSVQAVASTTATSSVEAPTLPPMKRFRVGGEAYGPVQDCRLDGRTVTCEASWDDPYQADTYTGAFTGTVTGLEMSGIWSTRQTGHDAADPGCHWQMETSAPAVYTFDPGGTLVIRQQAGQWRKTSSGNCSGTESGATEGSAEGGTLTWTVLE